ncbi:hypothetical protein Tco_0168026, partial [Tanacetum coccineum]
IQNHEQLESIPDTYVVNENNSNIVSDIPNMDLDRDNEEHDYVDYEQQRAFFASLSNNLKCDVEKCNKLLNDEILNLKSQACEKDKTFAKENKKYDKLRKTGQTDQTLRMLLLKEDNVNTGKQGLGFENQNDDIISEEELNCEAEKRLKVKQRKSPLSYHGFVYAETQFEEPPKVLLKRRNAMIKFEKQTFSKLELNQDELFRMSFEQSYEQNINTRVRNRLSDEFEPLVKNVSLQLNCFEKSLVKEMKDDFKYVMSLEDEFDETKREISNFKLFNTKSKRFTEFYMGESSKSFPKTASQFTTYSLQKDRKFSRKPQIYETPTPQKVLNSNDSSKKRQVFQTPDSRFTQISRLSRQRLLDGFQDDIKYEHVGPKTQDRKKVKYCKDDRKKVKYCKDDQVMMKDLKGKVKRKGERQSRDQDC